MLSKKVCNPFTPSFGYTDGYFLVNTPKKLHLPWVAALIVGGIVAGPSGLNFIPINETIEFIAEMGIIFLMFMAGLEVKMSSFKETRKDIGYMAFVNGLIPFLVGVLIFQRLGYGSRTALLMGTIFVSSSIAVVTPTLEENGLINKKFGRAVISAIMLQDVASLVLVSVVLQGAQPSTSLPFFIFYPAVFVTIVALRLIIPHTKDLIIKMFKDDDMFQHELRLIFLMLLGTVVIFQFLGLHAIIGGFFAGLLLSEFVTDNVVIGKLRAISYGIFIPTFFVVVGLRTDIHMVTNFKTFIPLVLLTVGGSITSKLISGYLGARMINYNVKNSIYFGAASISQLSTTLAVAYTAEALGLIGADVHTTLVILSVVSTFLGPAIMNKLDRHVKDNSTKEINLL